MDVNKSLKVTHERRAKMNTVDALSRLKSGLMAPHNFRKLQATKRVLKLRLSVCCDVESVHQAGINSVDLDSVEKR